MSNLRLICAGIASSIGGLACAANAASIGQVERTIEVAPFDIRQAESRAARTPDTVAPGVPHAADLASAGKWVDQDGWSTWTYAVQVPGAKSLAFHAKVALPASAKLHVADADGNEVKVYDIFNTLNTGSQIWSVLVPGDTAQLSLVVPTAEKASTALNIDTLYLGVKPSPLAPRAMTESAVPNATTTPSQVNWSCDRSSANEQAGDATVMYTVNASNPNGTGPELVQCTGQLMNDVPQDGKLYMGTAAHCGLSNWDASTMTVYWNRVSSCSAGLMSAQSAPGPTTSGGTTRAVFATGGINHEDQWLIELSGNGVPAGSNAVFIGWDASNVFAESGGGPANIFGINHASGETKQYTASTNGPTQSATPFLQYALDVGDPLAGASGSGAFEANERMFGTLTAAGATNANGQALVGYMPLSVGWKGDGGTNNPASALGAWLDPNNTGTLQLDYKIPVEAPTVGISVNPVSVVEGTRYTVTWSSANATSCSASGAWTGPQALNGSQSQSQSTSGTFNYVLTCAGAGGSTSASAAEVVNAPTGGSSSSGGSTGGGSGGGGGGGSLDLVALAMAAFGAARRRKRRQI